MKLIRIRKFDGFCHDIQLLLTLKHNPFENRWSMKYVHILLLIVGYYSMGRIRESRLMVWKKGESCKRRRQHAERERKEKLLLEWIERRERSTKEWWKSLKGIVKRREEGRKSGFWGPTTVPLTFFLQWVTVSFHSTPKYYSLT